MASKAGGSSADAQTPEQKNWLIHMHYVRKDYNTCRALISEQQQENSFGVSEYGHFVRGMMLRSQGRVQESLEAFQQCVLLNPNSVPNLKQLARSLFLLGRYKASIDIYNEAIKLTPDDYDLHHNIALCFYHQSDFNQAKDRLKQALTLQRNERSWKLLAKIQQQQNDLAGTIDSLKKALECSPENCEVLTQLGSLYMDVGQYGKAFECFGTALSFDPTYPDAILGAASMMQQNADYDVAITKYRVVAERQPESAAVWNNIGLCFLGKRKFVAALSCLKRANYLAPLDWKTLYNLGMLYLHMQQYASAFQFLSAAINHRPKMSQLYMMLAVALTHLDDTENARLAYEEALKIDQRDPLISLNFAVFSYKVKNDASAAAKHYSDFERKVNQLKASGLSDFDPEMFEVANALGAAIHVGDRTMWTATGDTMATDTAPKGNASTSTSIIDRASPTFSANGDVPTQSSRKERQDGLHSGTVFESDEGPRSSRDRPNPTAGYAAAAASISDSAASIASASSSRRFEPRAATLSEADKDDSHSSWSAMDFGKHVLDEESTETSNWEDDKSGELI